MGRNNQEYLVVLCEELYLKLFRLKISAGKTRGSCMYVRTTSLNLFGTPTVKLYIRSNYKL